jgi:NAD(P) transhydrogenase subunit alpha
MPLHASQLYSRNIAELLRLLVKDGELVLDDDDQIIRDMTLTRDGEVVHAPTRALLEEART